MMAVLSVSCESAPPAREPAEAAASAASDEAQATSPGPTVATATTPAQQTETFLSSYDFDDRLSRFDLPGRLDEISGIAFTADGRLFAHDDERARVYEIDPATGEVGKRFDLGEGELRDDFEDIAIVGDRFFLVSSKGWLYEFREGADRENVPYRVTEPGVGANCEVEGLDYDPGDDALVIACKVATPDRSVIVVHRLPILPDSPRLPTIRVPKASLVPFGLDAEFAPSAILVTPQGTWLLASAQTESLVEIDPDKGVIAAVALRKGRHPQPEGLALGADGLLYVSDEKNGQDARISVYAPRHESGR